MGNDSVKVSIIIPTYNQVGYLKRAIESALAQPYENLEIVVSDDCSTDGTQDLIKEAFSDKRIAYFRNDANLGRVGNYRRALYKYATGDFVLVLDGDDWLNISPFIALAVELLSVNSSVSCVFGDRENYDEKSGSYTAFSNRLNPFVERVMDGTDFFINIPTMGFVFSHFSCLYRRELAIELDFYGRDILASDTESILRLVPGRRVGYLPISVGVWRSHLHNASNRDVIDKVESLSKYDSLFDYVTKLQLYEIGSIRKWRDSMKARVAAHDFAHYIRRSEFMNAFRVISLSRDKAGVSPFKIIRACVAGVASRGAKSSSGEM